VTQLYLIDEAAGILDEVQAWLLAKADNEGWVYTMALRQLVNRMYRDRDYQAKRVKQGRQTAYDYALDRDQKALAWAIRALVRFVPPDEKALPEPPPKPRKPSRRLSPAQRTVYKGKPSWNYQSKRDWDGPDLPPAPVHTPSTLGWDLGELAGRVAPPGMIAQPAADADEQGAQWADAAPRQQRVGHDWQRRGAEPREPGEFEGDRLYDEQHPGQQHGWDGGGAPGGTELAHHGEDGADQHQQPGGPADEEEEAVSRDRPADEGP
jgi:hypothetical protein